MKIRKAVIPVAGKGTRFLPATKEIPKEMIPLINKPVVHYAVEEALGAGIDQIIFITSQSKEDIEDYFSRNIELEEFLLKNNKPEQAELVKNIGNMIEVITVRQKEQMGLGHAINCAKHIVGNEPFAVILADDVILSDISVTKQLLDVSVRNNNKSVIGVMEIPKEQTHKYGVVAGEFIKGDAHTMRMRDMVEKPKPEVAPSNLATPGRYILTPDIFDCLKRIPRGVGGEYQLTDAIKLLALENEVYAHIFDGDRYDTGSLDGYLNATVEFALRRPDTKEIMKKIILDKIKRFNIQ